MDFKDTLLQLAERIEKQKDNVATEEATKNAFIMPMIAALGYDVFNPFEVVPELDCDLVKKKGEKIDYAIKKNDETILLIECKHCRQDLNLHDTQLKKYFAASNARFGVLTNGIEYRFYTDLEKVNIMDDKPFLVIDILDMSDNDIEQLKKFHKSYYNEENILSTAQELKYTTELRNLICKEFDSPSPDFVKFFTKQVYDGVVNQRVIDQFTPLIKKSIMSIVNDTISDRLNLAIKTNEGAVNDSTVSQPMDEEVLPDGVVFYDKETGVATTGDELDGFLIVKAILRPVVDISRVYFRDTLSYFGILLDDNNRKPICRLYFNAQSVKYISTFDENKKETKHEIKSLDDIYDYTEQLRATISYYDKK